MILIKRIDPKVGHKKIQIAVVVIIGPGGTERIIRFGGNLTFLHQPECAVSLVVPEGVGAQIGHKEIQPAIVVVVPPNAAVRILFQNIIVVGQG